MRSMERMEQREIKEDFRAREESLERFKQFLRGEETPRESGEETEGEKKEFSPQFLERIPEARRETVEKAYENAEPKLCGMIEKYGDGLSVKDARIRQSGGYANYEIHMRRGLDHDEYGEVFRHELGHYLDERQGWYSERPEYLNAVYDDTMLYETGSAEGRKAREEMLNELFSGDVCYDRNVSDIITATTRNSPGVFLRYAREGVPCYRHPNSYLEKGHNRENEIYADMMACMGENRQETVSFLKKYFPNAYEATEKSIEANVD